MDKTVYVCEGTCGAVITQEQFDSGLIVCGAKGCTLEKHAFTKAYQCSHCSEIYKDQSGHAHPQK